MLMLRSIAPAIITKLQEKKLPSSLSYFSVALFLLLFFFAGSVSLSTMVVYLCGSLMVLTPTGKMRTLAIRVYFRGIEDFTENKTVFTRAKSAILQSGDFNLDVDRTRKIPCLPS